METKAPTAGESVGMKGNAPPEVITVDKSGEPSSAVSQAARTPKHANKSKEEDHQHTTTTSSSSQLLPSCSQQPPHHAKTKDAEGGPPFHTGPNYPPPFHPPTRAAAYRPDYVAGAPPMQVSPGSGRYYHYNGPPRQYYERYDYAYNARAPSYYTYDPRYYGRPVPDERSANFSRAVSNSFDRSIKDPKPDTASVEGDASWGALKQVHSVDEEEMRKRLLKRKNKDSVETNSNSSSLTNSPTEGVESKKLKTADSMEKDEKMPPSPDGSAPSLDLVKCPSGTSALLLPEHQRSLSQFSLAGSETKKEEKKLEKKKPSPLSITCSPPGSPKVKKDPQPKVHQPQPVYPKNTSPGFYDKQYQYERPSSAASSTITPMNVDQHDMRQPPGVGQMPSWEINAQDSFGANSATLMGAFSFPQDYAIPTSASAEMMQPQMESRHPMESRNQSFEGGHYHGSYRNDMYEGQRQMSFDGRYQGSFPPQAPSWGSAGSYPYPQHRMGYPMMRNYSEDSGRASPPRMNFPPPPEFHVPPSMVNKGPGQQQTLMTSPYTSTPKVGPFGWTKEEDKRLTDIMKKYKNARDWEPIAKEHNRGRTAKECHERWIRYLKPGVRKGQWTDHEDAIVMEVVENSTEQPFTRWSDLAQRLPGRVGKQIRDRWVNHLNPAIDHMPFSRDDDLRLWEGHQKLGKRWVEISTKFFNNRRSENHIKNRWYSATFKKFIANEFGPDAYNTDKASPPKKKSANRSVDPEMEAV